MRGRRSEKVLAYEVSVRFIIQVSRDSGVVSPSDISSIAAETATEPIPTASEYNPKPYFPAKLEQNAVPAQNSHPNLNLGDPDPHLASRMSRPLPVKAELVTNELDDVNDGSARPPPYHIAAARSKHAGEFSQIMRVQHLTPSAIKGGAVEEHFYENQVGRRRASDPNDY